MQVRTFDRARSSYNLQRNWDGSCWICGPLAERPEKVGAADGTFRPGEYTRAPIALALGEGRCE
jgi:hypothetical protein